MPSSEKQNRHVVILPYYCDEEVTRYLRIAERIAEFPKPEVPCDYLLAASPRTEHSVELEAEFSKLGKTIAFQCPTQIFGYPEGPTAMFWDCMDFIAENYEDSTGFALWLESDMAPIKPDWIDRLSAEWYEDAQTPIMMGCFVPNVYTRKLFKPSTLVVEKHINGGACYAMDFARKMPEDARTGIFDMAVYQFANELGRAKRTGQIAFSTTKRARRDLSDSKKVLLHGFMQEKDAFVDRCLNPLSGVEHTLSAFNPALEQLETAQRLFNVCVVAKEDRPTALDNVLLSIRSSEANEKRRIQRAA